MRRLVSCAVAGALLCGGANAEKTAEAGAVERIGDWELVCPQTGGKPDAKARPGCRLVQSHAGETGGTVLLVTIVLQEGGKTPVAVVSVPQGVYLAPGIEMKLDDGQAFKLLYETCNSSGCHAGFKVAGDIAKALRKGQTANHIIHDSKQKPVTIPVSLKGMSKALDRLQEAGQ